MVSGKWRARAAWKPDWVRSAGRPSGQVEARKWVMGPAASELRVAIFRGEEVGGYGWMGERVCERWELEREESTKAAER